MLHSIRPLGVAIALTAVVAPCYGQAIFEGYSDIDLALRLKVQRKLESPARPEAILGSNALSRPRTTLQDALDSLSDRLDLVFDINDSAFKSEGIEDVLALKVGGRGWRRESRISAGAILRMLLAKVPSTSGATYVIRGDWDDPYCCIEITTRRAVEAEIPRYKEKVIAHFWRSRRPQLPTIDEVCDRIAEAMELYAALKERAGTVPTRGRPRPKK